MDQGVQQLPLILVQPLDLHVEDEVGVRASRPHASAMTAHSWTFFWCLMPLNSTMGSSSI